MKICSVTVFTLIFCCLMIVPGHAGKPPQAGLKQVDTNKDGMPDVIYYHDGHNIQRVEADTNKDGKADIVLRKNKGTFESAQGDTDFDGKRETTFSDDSAFKAWLNEKHPELNDAFAPNDLTAVGAMKW